MAVFIHLKYCQGSRRNQKVLFTAKIKVRKFHTIKLRNCTQGYTWSVFICLTVLFSHSPGRFFYQVCPGHSRGRADSRVARRILPEASMLGRLPSGWDRQTVSNHSGPWSEPKSVLPWESPPTELTFQFHYLRGND